VWNKASTEQKLESISTEQVNKSSISITTVHMLANKVAKLTTQYLMSANGQ